MASGELVSRHRGELERCLRWSRWRWSCCNVANAVFLLGIRTGLVGVIGRASVGGELGGLGSCDTWADLTGRRALTAILVVEIVAIGRMLWNSWDGSRALFLQAEAVEVGGDGGDSGGEDSDDVAAEVGGGSCGLFWFCLETRKDLGDIIIVL